MRNPVRKEAHEAIKYYFENFNNDTETIDDIIKTELQRQIALSDDKFILKLKKEKAKKPSKSFEYF